MTGGRVPGHGWDVDAFLYECPGRQGVLFLAWHGRETRARYAGALRHDSTPWHGRWEVFPPNSNVLPWAIKTKWTRTVYFDFGGEEDKVKPMYIGLDRATDFFMGIDSDGGRIGLAPLTVIGVGLEYGGLELTAMEELFCHKSRRRIVVQYMSALVNFFWRRARM